MCHPDKKFNIYDITGFLLYENCVRSLRGAGFETGISLLTMKEIIDNRWTVHSA